MTEQIQPMPDVDPNAPHDTGPVFEYTQEQRDAMAAATEATPPAPIDPADRQVPIGERGTHMVTRPDGGGTTATISGDGMRYSRGHAAPGDTAMKAYERAEQERGLAPGSLTGKSPEAPMHLNPAQRAANWLVGKMSGQKKK